MIYFIFYLLSLTAEKPPEPPVPLDGTVESFMISDLLKQIVHRESRGNPTVISSEKCVGLYQIHPMYFLMEGVNVDHYIKDGKFTMPVEMQNHFCKVFVKEQIKHMILANIKPTNQRIFQSWAGIAYIK